MTKRLPLTVLLNSDIEYQNRNLMLLPAGIGFRFVIKIKIVNVRYNSGVRKCLTNFQELNYYWEEMQWSTCLNAG